MVKFKRKLKFFWHHFDLLSTFSLLIIICILPVPLINGGEDDSILLLLNTKKTLSGCQCQYDNIQNLITKSPIIIKALGAKIFNDKVINYETNKKQQKNSEINQSKLNSRKKETLIRFINKNNNYNNNNNNKNINLNAKCANKNNKNNLNVITLTPETIYKGASILKFDSQADKISKFYSDDSFRKRRQLNAEFGPIECFNQGTLNLLPAQLIVFGKLISNNQQQQQQENYNNFDTLQIYPNGIHSWSPELESYIWKHLGWDNWSDFTLCSVTCGKGVQQRFRRCLLDNISSSLSSSSSSSTSSAVSTLNPITFVNNNSNKNSNNNNNKNNNNNNNNNNNQNDSKEFSLLQQEQEQTLFQNSKDFMNNYHQEISSEYGLRNEFRFNFENNESIIKHKNKMINGRKLKLLKNKKNHKKRTTKGMTTLSCEGYNIEQRNCNMFDCDDYLTDLLKFLRRTINDPTTPPLPSSIAGALSYSSEMNFDVKTSTPSTTRTLPSSASSLSSSSASSSSSSSLSPSYSTSGIQLKNSGFIQGWQNSINFTIMITLKLKAPRQSTIFELRNSTHNLYLDQSENGLKLFQERDEVTEMLPIKFDLYDNRWHQIAISVFNGDFITMYVDCMWTNSFVVSKHLFALPLNADVEIGREYAGDEVQQLLILPGNREKQQCSAERTSINEVKRYIIDTFIEDYGN